MSLLLEGWQRPVWLLLILSVPLLYWLRSRSQRPRVLPTGTLSIWRRVAEQEHTSGRARRRRPPSWVLWLLLAWSAAAIGLAEWRGRGRVLEPTRWLVVDARAAAWGPAQDTASVEGRWPETTRLEFALREVLERYPDGALWQIFDGRAVHSLKRADFEPWFDELRSLGPADFAPDWEAWDRGDVLWIVPSAEGMPRPLKAGLWAVGGSEAAGPVARAGQRWAWFEADRVSWREAPAWAPVQCRSVDLSGMLADFAQAYAAAHGLQDAQGPCEGAFSLEWRTHPLPFDGDWEAEIAGVRVRVAVSDTSIVPRPRSAVERWSASRWGLEGGAPLLLLGPGWISCAAGEWQILSGDAAALALELGRLADAQWLPEPGLLPSAARRDQGTPLRIDPQGAWDALGGKRRGAGRFTALALALAAGATWVAASRGS